MIGDFNRRITIKRWDTTQSDGGGLNAVEVDTWDLWALVENYESTYVNSGKRYGSGGGSSSTGQDQQQWANSFKVTIRFDPDNPVNSNDTIDYEGMRMSIGSLNTQNEGKARYQIARCSVTLEL